MTFPELCIAPVVGVFINGGLTARSGRIGHTPPYGMAVTAPALVGLAHWAW